MMVDKLNNTFCCVLSLGEGLPIYIKEYFQKMGKVMEKYYHSIGSK